MRSLLVIAIALLFSSYVGASPTRRGGRSRNTGTMPIPHPYEQSGMGSMPNSGNGRTRGNRGNGAIPFPQPYDGLQGPMPNPGNGRRRNRGNGAPPFPQPYDGLQGPPRGNREPMGFAPHSRPPSFPQPQFDHAPSFPQPQYGVPPPGPPRSGRRRNRPQTNGPLPPVGPPPSYDDPSHGFSRPSSPSSPHNESPPSYNDPSHDFSHHSEPPPTPLSQEARLAELANDPMNIDPVRFPGLYKLKYGRLPPAPQPSYEDLPREPPKNIWKQQRYYEGTTIPYGKGIKDRQLNKIRQRQKKASKSKASKSDPVEPEPVEAWE